MRVPPVLNFGENDSKSILRLRHSQVLKDQSDIISKDQFFFYIQYFNKKSQTFQGKSSSKFNNMPDPPTLEFPRVSTLFTD